MIRAPRPDTECQGYVKVFGVGSGEGPFSKGLSPVTREQSQLHYIIAEIVLERFAEDERGVTAADRGVVTEAGAAEL